MRIAQDDCETLVCTAVGSLRYLESISLYIRALMIVPTRTLANGACEPDA